MSAALLEPGAADQVAIHHYVAAPGQDELEIAASQGLAGPPALLDHPFLADGLDPFGPQGDRRARTRVDPYRPRGAEAPSHRGTATAPPAARGVATRDRPRAPASPPRAPPPGAPAGPPRPGGPGAPPRGPRRGPPAHTPAGRTPRPPRRANRRAPEAPKLSTLGQGLSSRNRR